MEQFGISIRFSVQPEAFQLKDRIEQQLEYLHTDPGQVQLVLDMARYEPRITCEFMNSIAEHTRKEILNHIANVIAEWITEVKEAALISQIMRADYEQYSAAEVVQIQQYIQQIMHDAGQHSEGMNRRKHKIVTAVLECLTERSDIHVDGMIRFRLQSYLNDLREVIDYAVDEFVMDKQYQEFITLLKYFVFVQETKIEKVHLLHRGNYEFMLLDEHLVPLETKQMEGVVLEMLDHDLNYEDMIVSTLITVSPQTLYIHTAEREMQVIRTIKQIFDERAVLCNDSCTICQHSIRKDLALTEHSHLYT